MPWNLNLVSLIHVICFNHGLQTAAPVSVLHINNSSQLTNFVGFEIPNRKYPMITHAPLSWDQCLPNNL